MHVPQEFDDEQAEKLSYIQQQTNQEIAEILSEAVDLYYQKLQQLQPVKNQKSPFEIFQELGLVGCIKDADPNLSRDYKSLVHQEIEDRHEREQE